MARSKANYRRAAKKAATTRKKNQARTQRAKASRTRERERELQKIERALGEEFSSLAEARRALQSESKPAGGEITTLDEWEEVVDYATEEGQEEFEGAIDYA